MLTRLLPVLLLAGLAAPAMAQPTGSDDCSTAFPINGTGVFNFDNSQATPLTRDALACNVNRDVWFRWTAPTTGEVTLTTCGLTDVDTVLSVYGGQACSGIPLACNDNSAGCGAGSRVVFGATAGQVYTIRVGSYWTAPSGGAGELSIVYAGDPSSADTCTGAQQITGTGVFEFDTSSASSSPGDPPSCELMGRDVWFDWTAPESGHVRLSTCGLGVMFDTVLAVYNGAQCPAADPIICENNDPNCPGWYATVEFPVVAGNVYKIRVGSPGGATGGPGRMSLELYPPVTNDECSTARTISGTGLFPVSTASATNSPDEGCVSDGDVWFRWTAPAGVHTVIHACGLVNDAPTDISVYEDNGCPVGEPLACNSRFNDICWQARVDFFPEAGRTYLIRIGTHGGWFIGSGSFAIEQDTNTGGGGETIYVDTITDTLDFGGFLRLEDLPGPDGLTSFREAVTAANFTPGPQTVGFNIPRDRWGYAVTHPSVENRWGYPFVVEGDGTIIDGSTQTAFTGDTNPDGPEISFGNSQGGGSNSPNIIVRADDCELKYLGGALIMGWNYWIEGDNCRIIGCQITSSVLGGIEVRGSNTQIGGTGPGEGNLIRTSQDAVLIEAPATNTTLINSELIKGRLWGVVINGAHNTRIGGPSSSERNTISGSGTYIIEGSPTGGQIRATNANGLIIENNLIGLRPEGDVAMSNIGPGGLILTNCSEALIKDNVISGIYTEGVNHHAGERAGTALGISGGSGAIVQGNLLGTDAWGQGSIPNFVSVSVSGGHSGMLFGGQAPGQGNVVAHSIFRGVVISGGSNGNTLSRSPIYDTQENVGILLAGGNNGQNFPTLTSARLDGALIVAGTLASVPGEQFRIEFFASPACDPSGFGEGQTFLGDALTTTNASGMASYSATVAGFASPGDVVTATATRLSTGDTSQFSNCVTVVEGPACPADFDSSGALTLADFVAFRNAYVAGDLAADFDGSGSLTLNDFVQFRNAYVGGC